MAVRVRLTRVGSKKNAMWRVVVADRRSPRDGRFIEMIGHYNPHTQPSQIVIDRERLDHWISKGAEPSDTVRKLMRAPNSQPNAPAVAEAPADETPAPAPEAEGTPPSEGTGTPPSEGTGTPPSEGTGDAEAAASERAGDAPAEAESSPDASPDTPPTEGTGPAEGTSTPPAEGTGTPPSEGTGEAGAPADADAGDADAAAESGNESG